VSKIEIKVTAVGDADMPGEKLRREIERECQHRANEGRTLRAMGSRGGTMYLVFAAKIKGEPQ
jgi:hypothetical protein